MTLRDYLRVFRERWRLIVSLVLVALILGIVTTKLTTKSYQATAQVLVQSNGSSDALANLQSALYAQSQVSTFADLIDTPDIIRLVQQDLNGTVSSSEYRSEITAVAPTGRNLVNITATDGSASRAAALANSTARAFATVIQRYSIPVGAKSKTPAVAARPTAPAIAPDHPVSPNAVVNIAVALVVGVLVAVSAAVLREVLDNRIKTEERLGEAASAPVMGVIIDDPMTAKYPVATRAGRHNTRAENFRQVRANLQFANVDVHPRLIAITSSIPGEGKTSIAINLASTLAETGFRVCLVDADLRRPAIANSFGLVSTVGLTNVLIQQIDLGSALQEVGEGLSVLTSGPVPPNPSEVLSSSYVRTMIRSLVETFDYVIIDTAPLLPVADGSEVAALADGTLLVAQHMKTTDSQVKRAAQMLRRVDAPIIGVVLNRVRQSRTGPYGYAYYRYASSGDTRPSKVKPGRARPTPRGNVAAGDPEALEPARSDPSS